MWLLPMLNTPMARLATAMPMAAADRTSPRVCSSVRSSIIGVRRVCRNPMQKVIRVTSSISTTMPRFRAKQTSPPRKSSQNPFSAGFGSALMVRHTTTVNDTVVTIVATSIIRTASMPDCTITSPATAGEMRYCAAAPIRRHPNPMASNSDRRGDEVLRGRRQLRHARGARVLLGGQQVGDGGAVGRVEQRLEDRTERDAGADHPDLAHTRVESEQQGHQANRRQGVAEDHHQTPVEPIHQDPGQRREQQTRQERGYSSL